MKNNMRIVYMGTPDIAKTCLQALCEGGYEVVGVYTKPDTPKNRGMKMAMSPVKEYALSQNLPVYQPTTFKDDAVVEELRGAAPKFFSIGNCVKPDTITHTVYQGYHAALDI